MQIMTKQEYKQVAGATIAPAESPEAIEPNYSVILLYPDYATETFGHETYWADVRADSPAEAIEVARTEAIAHNTWDDDGESRCDIDDPTDFFVVAVTDLVGKVYLRDGAEQ